jgi:type I restriction enzyme M protein
MANVGAVISSIRNIMRQDRGISGDAQRLEQLGWMLFLKIMGDKDQELEIIKDNYVSVIPSKFQWSNWASDPEGITGDELLEFIDSNSEDNKGLFASLKNLTSNTNPERAAIVKEVFDGSNNYMKSGYELRKVINKLNEINFNNSEDKHIFGNIYESILQELRDAGNKGEYYTPRAVTQLMTKMTNPKLGEKVLDPAAGTGGFLSAAIDHVRDNYVKTVDDEHILQKSITGWELKPVAYVLGLTNLILHEMDVPDYHYIDSLKKEYNGIGSKDRVDVILANPPFGASIADGVETNFPATFRCKESADLFIILMMQMLKQNGRCAIVLPDGSLTGDGVKSRIREKLMTDCNLHTIIRMPTSTFFPAAVATNLLFFDKGSNTKEIWYYEHKLPVGQKSYSKTKPIQFKEFSEIIKWWDNRVESDVAWKVDVNELQNWDLDIKNPFEKEEISGDLDKIYKTFKDNKANIEILIEEIVNNVFSIDNDLIMEVINKNLNLLCTNDALKIIKSGIIKNALKGDLTNKWRKDNPNFEASSELIKKIKKNKEILIKEKGLRYESVVRKSLANQNQFDIPNKWEWTFLDELVIFTNGKAHEQFVNSNGDYVLVNSKFVSTNGMIKKYASEILTPLYKNDIAIVMSDVPNGRALSRCFLVDQDEKYTLNQRIGSLTSIAGINPEYLKMILDRNPHYLSFNDGKKQTNLKKEQILNCPIPLPSLEEQIIIVQEVHNLLKKCEILENEIYKSEKLNKLLMDVVLKEAFEINELIL